MLCVIPPNVLPSREKLENSALNNPDGFGYAIAIPEEQRILVAHTMSADEAINDFLALKAKYPQGYAMWHARLATHGSMCLDNCHPFQVGKDSKTFLAHNGILPTIHEKSDRSDTRILAETILPRMGGVAALDDPQMWSVLEEFTAGSKVAVLSVNPQAKYQIYLLHEKSGKYDESEVWWSNDSHTISYYTGTTKLSYDAHYPPSVIGGTSSVRPTLDWALCAVCATEFDTWENVFCPRCSACLECTQSRVACMCYNPADRAYFDATYPSAWAVE
jgi:glutamine amidotransferase